MVVWGTLVEAAVEGMLMVCGLFIKWIQRLLWDEEEKKIQTWGGGDGRSYRFLTWLNLLTNVSLKCVLQSCLGIITFRPEGEE